MSLTKIEVAVCKDNVYFCSRKGIFRWNQKDRIAHQLVNVEETKYLKRMSGKLQVSKDETFYFLGILGNDGEYGAEGATDLVCLKESKNS